MGDDDPRRRAKLERGRIGRVLRGIVEDRFFGNREIAKITTQRRPAFAFPLVF